MGSMLGMARWLEILTEQDRWRSNDEKLVDTPGEDR